MIEIPTAKDLLSWESYQDGDDLMERACTSFANWFSSKFNTNQKVNVVCGTGNNGGDGLGIARLLKAKKFDVAVWIIKSEKQSDGFLKNRKRIPDGVAVVEITDASSFNPEYHDSILIDGIFGTGLTRPVEGIYADVIEKFNSITAIKVAIDIPSGLLADKPSSGAIVKADYTVTFILPKLALMFPHHAEYVGEWHLEDLGLSMSLQSFFGDMRQSIRCNYYVDDRSVRTMLHDRKKFSHKGNYGHALLIAGSYGKMGAAVLAAKAALRSGVGLLTVHVPKCGYEIIQTSVPEAMVSIDTQEDYFSHVADLEKYDVIGIGPGLGKTASTATGLKKVLDAAKPMVIDADALNIIAGNPDLLHGIPGKSILTPHPGEFERLVGKSNNGFARLHLQENLSNTTKNVVVLKGAHTSITPGAYFNSTGNPGMAKGGSGDVLTGVLTGLLSQGYTATEAAIIGVYCHGLAGDLAAGKIGKTSLLAGDIVEFLGQAFGR